MLADLVQKNRSYRRFNPNRKVTTDELRTLVDLARQTASARNMQPLKYVLVNDERCSMIFPLLAWAGYLKDWKGPDELEQPVAYILVMRDNTINTKHYCDDGIAMQTILLGAVEMGLGGCMIGAFNKQQLSNLLGIPEQFEVLNVIALGEPQEEVVLEELTDDVQYWRDENDVHHVPKRKLDEVIVNLKKDKI